MHWHVSLFFTALAAATLLYLLGLRIFGHWLAAVVVALLVMLSPDPGPTQVWYKPGSRAENIGILLVLMAILAMSYASVSRRNREDMIAFLLVALAALAKESFILLIPALIGLRLWMETHETGLSISRCVRRLSALITAYLFLAAVLLGIIFSIVYSGNSGSYGGRSFHISSADFISNLSRSVRMSLGMAGWFVPAIMAIMTALKRPGLKFKSSWFFSILIFALWVIPQFLLYATRGVMWDHYWIPCVIGLAGINAAGMKYIIDRGAKRINYICLIVVAVWSLNAMRVDAMAISNFSERAAVQQKTVETTAANIPQNGRIAIVADMTTQSELTFSFLCFLGLNGSTNSTAYLYDITHNKSGLVYNDNDGFVRGWAFPEAPSFAKVPLQCMDAIIFLSEPSPDDSLWSGWYDSKSFLLRPVTGRQRYISIKKFGVYEESFIINVAFNRSHNKGEGCS